MNTLTRQSRMLGLAVILLLAGCEADPISKSSTDNAAVAVELLFTHDGCKVYRFHDGRYHYFTNCRGSTVTTWAESCGKGCVRELETENRTAVLP